MAKTDVQHDVIVIGAGIAGLVTANRAAQLGKRVIVLEKSKEEKYLCNSRYTYGTFHINFTDVGADEDLLFGKIEACSEGLARKALARAVAKDGRRLMQWLKSEGIDLVDLGGIEVATDAAEGAAKFNAPSVVIADGGFQANFDMIRAHISAAPEKSGVTHLVRIPV